MKRRQVLHGIAAGSAMSVGLAGAANRKDVEVVDIQQYSAIHIKDGNRVVETVENPTWDDVKRLNGKATDSQTVVTPDGDCTEYCCSQCYCSSCLCGCTNCCNIDKEICDCCDCSLDGCEDADNCT